VPTRRAGYGVIHDHKQDRRSLLLCAGSMQQLALSHALAWQDALPGTGGDQNPEARLF
jgi:hypothetical protein